MNVLKMSLAEFIGTFALVFAGCGAVAVNQFSGGAVGHVGISLTFGLVIMAMIYAVGHISGAHFNPAVTVSFAVNRHFPLRHILPYIFAQCAGAVSAALILWWTFMTLPQDRPAGQILDLGVTLPADDSLVIGFVWEFILTFILMFVITAVATDTRAVGSAAGLAVGGTVGLEALFGGPVTGASMNPARSLGPALVMGNWKCFAVYLIGPLLGAVAAGFLYGYTARLVKKTAVGITINNLRI